MNDTHFDRYLLDTLDEELHEIGTEICKGHRFGLDDCDPGKPERIPVRDRLALEIGDFLGVVDMLVDRDIIDPDIIRGARENKPARVRSYYRPPVEVEGPPGRPIDPAQLTAEVLALVRAATINIGATTITGNPDLRFAFPATDEMPV